MTSALRTVVTLGVVMALASACGGGGGGDRGPGPVSAAVSTVGSAPASVVADGVTASTVTVALLDASAVPVPGKTVTLSSSRGAIDTISAASGLSSSSGVVTFTVTSLVAGSPSFTAVDGTDGVTLTPTAQVAFVSGPVSGTVSTVASSPAAVVADGSSSAAVTVTLRDANGNPIAGKAVSLSSSRGAADAISSASGASDADGVVTFSVSSTTAGSSTYTAEVELAALAQTAQVDFVVGAVSAIASTVSASPASVIADGTLATITVTVLDAHANPVPGKTVTLSSSRGVADAVSAASGASDASGAVTFTVGSTIAGSSTYTAEVDLLPIAETAQVGFVAGAVSATASTVGSSPASVVADGSTASTITVVLLDAYDNPVAGKAVSLSSSRGATDTISAASGASDALGMVTFTVRSATAGSSSYTAVDGTDGLTLAGTAEVAFVAGPVSASSSTVAASPSSVVADGSATSTVTVTLKDASGNPIAGKAVTLSSSRGVTDTISGASGVSSASGVVTFTVTSLVAGSPSLTAADGTDGLTLGQTAQVTFVAGPVSAAVSTVALSPASIVADGAAVSTITATLLDAHGNPVADRTVTLSSSRGATDAISAASGPSSAAGVVTFTVKSTVAGSPTFTAADGTDGVTITQTAQVAFVAGPASAASSTVATSAASVPADGSTTSTVTVTLLDANGNPVSGKTVTLSSSRGATDTISAASGASSAAGVVTFTVRSSTFGASTYAATDTSDSLAVTQTAPVTFRSYRLVFTTQPPASSTSGAAFSPQPVVAAQDAAGNTDPSFTSNVTLALSSNPTGTTLHGTLTVPAVNGVATFSGVYLTRAGTGYSLAATTPAAGISTAASTAFNVTPASPAQLAFTIQPSSTGAGIGPAIQVGVLDAYGNPTTANGFLVAVALGNNPGSATLGGTLTAASINGVATFSGLSVSANGVGYTLVASASGLGSATSQPFDITTPGAIGSGTAASCTEATLVAALTAGGNYRFQCGPSPVTITVTSQKTVARNVALDGGGLVTLSGGGTTPLFAVNGGVTLALANLTITGGMTSGNGGAIVNSGTLSIGSSIVTGNSASNDCNVGYNYWGSPANGGAIFNSGGTVLAVGSSFTGNTTYSNECNYGTSANGGALYNGGGTVVVTRSTFSGNSAGSNWGVYGTASNGGAIFNSGGALWIANSTFSANAASANYDIYGAGGNGGAIFNGGGALWMANATFSGNNASASNNYFGPGGGGGALYGGGTLTNTIVSRGTAGPNCSGSFTNGGHNLDSDGSCGVGAATSPLLASTGLASNGGPTQTIALQATSPAINAGDQTVCAASPVLNVDQRGYRRPGTGYASCSIGAYEYNSSGP